MTYYPVYEENTWEFIGIYKREELCNTIEFPFLPSRSATDHEEFNRIREKLSLFVTGEGISPTPQESKYFHDFNRFEIKLSLMGKNKQILVFLIDFEKIHPDAVSAARRYFSFISCHFN